MAHWLGAAVMLLIGGLGAALLWRERTAAVVAVSAAALFVAFALMGLTALVAPQLYRSAAVRALERAGVLSSVRQLDDQLVLNDVADVSHDLLDRVSAALGRGSDAGSGADARQPTRLVEAYLYPGLVTGVALVMRACALVLAASGMLAVVALNFAALLLADRRRLRRDVDLLQARVRRLESVAALESSGDAA